MVVERQLNNGAESYKRLAALTVASLLLCLSFVMSFFTSFPVALASVLYGRRKGYGAVAFAWLISFALSFFALKEPALFTTYTGSVFVTVAVVEIVLRGASPMKGIVVSGIALIAILFGLILAGLDAANTTPKKFVMDQIATYKAQIEESLDKSSSASSSEIVEVKALLSNPEKMAQEILYKAPGYMAMGVFIILWANVFMLLKLKRTVLGRRDAYTDWDLVQFKCPEQLIWAVVACLALILFGDQVGPVAEEAGLTGIKVLGVFYFFQGFGLYLSFLNFMGLGGFLRAVLIIATVITANEVLAIFGLFDMFVNFRKYMKRKDQGE